MKPFSLRRAFAVAALAQTGAAVLAFAALVWATATTQGTRWLLTSLLPLSGVNVTAHRIEGRLFDRLLLTGIRVTTLQQEMAVKTLELRWRPLLLLTGTVAIQELSVNGVRIQDDTPPDTKPPDLSWPKLPETAHLFDGTIARLRVSDISYRRLQDQPVLITSIDGSATWGADQFSLTGLNVTSPSGQASGSVAAGFKQPALTADLALASALPVAEMDRFSVQIRPGKNTSAKQFFGNVAVTGSAGTAKRLELSGEVGMAQNEFILKQLRLSSPQRGGVITADGSLTFTPREPVLSLQIKAAGLDLAPELNMPTDLSGTLKFAGTMDSYRGGFNFANNGKGWREAAVSASYSGSREEIHIAPLTARVLDGSLAGNLVADWRDGFTLRGTINGKNINPARIDPAWKGVANFSAAGGFSRSATGNLSGSVTGSLLESNLHGQELTGKLQAEYSSNNLTISRMDLQGKGFDLHASGSLEQRLTLSARITDLSLLVPGSSGTVRSDGWVRWRNHQLSGAATGKGSTLAYAGTQIAAATLTARLDEGDNHPGHIALSLQNAIHSQYALTAVTVTADGTLLRHIVHAAVSSGSSEAKLALSAGYVSNIWTGRITSLTGNDRNGSWNMPAPAPFAASPGKFTLSPLTLTTGTAERLEVAADLGLNPLSGQLRTQWSDFNLARANPYLKEVQMTGRSSGSVKAGFPSGDRLTLSGSASGSGTITRNKDSITIDRILTTFNGGEQGLRADVDLHESTGGSVKGTFLSSAPLLLALPEKGKLTAQWNGIDTALLKPWLPAGTEVKGHINGRANGIMLPGQRFELNGTASLSGGAVRQGELNLSFASAEATWDWQKETLSASLALDMAAYGTAEAEFQLPVSARFPVAVNRQAPLRGAVTGRFQEQGLLAALFPDVIQKSFGNIDAGVTLGGTWDMPQIGGTVRLAKAGAYLPSAGIHVKDVQLSARLEKDLIRIDSFRALSGPGHIEGNGLITLSGVRVTGYHGTLHGENFQTVYLPELRINCTPELSFEGTLHKLSLRGELRIPEMQLDGTAARTAVPPSGDVIREGIVAAPASGSPLALDVQIRILIGEKVAVKIAGIDARLGGAMDVSLSSLDKITSRGEITVAKGHFRTYGVDLEIVRGRLFFAGGPVDQPTLDFLALRTVGEVKAGVTVAGSIQNPIIKLYSEPPMPDVDVLAYIVLGHPYENNGEQAGLMTKAAGALLTSGQANVVQDQLKNRLGLSTLEIQGGVGANSGAMGYKPLPVTAPGAIPASSQPGVTDTVLTVGKYLTPQLYISYGKSLFTGNNMFLLRYDIFKKWQIETQTGSESGADLFYKLEFK